MKLDQAPGGTTADILQQMFQPAIEVLAEGVEIEGSPHWGRVASRKEPVSVEAVWELSAEEVAVLPADGFQGAPLNQGVQKLRARHHELARLMASGLKDSEIVERLGGSAQNLGLLRRNPAFQNLLLSFMASRDADAMDLAGQIKQTAALSLDLIQNRLEQAVEDPAAAEKLSPKFLLETATVMLDRAGFNPTQKHQVLNVGVTAKTLEELRNATPATVYRAEDVSPSSGRPRSQPGKVIDQPAELGQDGERSGGQGGGEKVREISRQEPEEVQLQLL